MGRLRGVGLLVALACVVVVGPSWAEDPDAIGPGEIESGEFGQMAQALLGDDAAGLDALASRMQSLDASGLRRLIDAIRVCAGSSVSEATPTDDERAEVLIETQVLEAPRALLADALGTRRPTARYPVHPVDNAVVKLLSRLVTTHGSCKSLIAPSIMTLDGEEARVQVLSDTSYVQDYDIEIGMGGRSLDKPILGTVQHGLTLTLDPSVSADAKSITIGLRCLWTDLKQPIADWKVMAEGIPIKGTDVEVTLQRPELTASWIDMPVTMASGDAVVVGGEPLLDRHGVPTQRVVLLRATRIEPSKSSDPK